VSTDLTSELAVGSSVAQAVQAAQAWVAENFDPSRDTNGSARRALLERIVDSGWAAPSWPRSNHGLGLDAEVARATDSVFRTAGVDGYGQDVVNLWAGTIISAGSDELKAKHIRSMLLGEVNMCLLYSEPGAGSDLASIRTSAVRDGDEWIINGQKVWTSGGRSADYALLITRTDLDVPKHRGITFFFLAMKQEGVEVRPLRQATGDARFNEVFITDARVPHENMLGDYNRGWWVLQTALAYERAVMGQSGRRRASQSSTESVRKSDSEAGAPVPDVSLLDLAKARGVADDPMLRQRLMRLREMVAVNEWNGQRAKAAMKAGSSSPLMSLGKLAMSGILHTAGSLQASILGTEAMLAGDSSPDAADATYSMLNAFFTSIGGGTDQIQRNIIGERILGLPKEPEIDKDVAFRDVRTG
jgi:alkylation response protein AidB-like acyl-CoA dehydrogenase